MELATERLLLREYHESDWRDVRAYQSDPRYLKFYEWTDRTPEAVQAFISMFLQQQAQQPRIKFQLAIILKTEPERVIGSCGIRRSTSDSKLADIGYELAPDQWGNGFATEAAQAILRFGFTEFDLHRVWSWCIAENAASARVLEKLGMRREGHLRENEYFKGRWWDTLIFGLLRAEWEDSQR